MYVGSGKLRSVILITARRQRLKTMPGAWAARREVKMRRTHQRGIAIASLGFIVAAAQPAVSQQVIGTGPGGILICNGPLGPGPCAQVQQWIMTHRFTAPPGRLVAPPILPGPGDGASASAGINAPLPGPGSSP